MVAPGRKVPGPCNDFRQRELDVLEISKIILIGKNGGEAVPHDINGLCLVFRTVMGLDKERFGSARHLRVNFLPAALEKLMPYGFPNALFRSNITTIVVLGESLNSKDLIENDPKQGIAGTRVRCEPNDHKRAGANRRSQVVLQKRANETGL